MLQFYSWEDGDEEKHVIFSTPLFMSLLTYRSSSGSTTATISSSSFSHLFEKWWLKHEMLEFSLETKISCQATHSIVVTIFSPDRSLSLFRNKRCQFLYISSVRWRRQWWQCTRMCIADRCSVTRWHNINRFSSANGRRKRFLFLWIKFMNSCYQCPLSPHQFYRFTRAHTQIIINRSTNRL